MRTGYARSRNPDKNPIRQDMAAAAALAKLSYITNVVINEDKNAAAAFAGDPVKAHEADCAFLKPYCQVQLERITSIVVTSNGGTLLDQNIYQTVKGLY